MPGVCRAPAASTTSGARDLEARARAGRRRRAAGRATPTARVPLPQHAIDARVGEQRRAGARARAAPRVTSIDCLAPVGQPSAQLLSPTQRRMLRGARASGQPSALGAAHEEVRVPAEGVLVVRLDVQDALGLVEVRLHGARAEAGEAELALPACSSTGSGVRHDMPPLMTVEPPTQRPSAKMIGGLPRIIAGAGVAVEPADHRRRIGGEGLGAVQPAFLEHQHVAPGVAQPGRGRGAAGAGADHDGVGVQDLIAAEARADGHVRVLEAVLRRLGKTMREHVWSQGCRSTATSIMPSVK